MEIIPQETIDIIVDFVNHLSEEQIGEYGRQFMDKHPFFDGFIDAATEELKNDDAKELMMKSYIIMLKCFDYYAVELPPIPEEIIQNEMLKWTVNFQNINPNFPEKAKIGILKKHVIQKNLVEYLTHELIEVPEQLAFFRKVEVLPSVLTFFVMTNAMHRHLESLLPKDSE
jgi:hypothetical protein